MNEPVPPARRRRRPRPVIDHGPQPIADALDTVMSGLMPRTGRPTPRDDANRDGEVAGAGRAPSAAVWGTVFSRWEELVGASLARHTRPLRLEAGVLVVAVDLPPWATQVRALAPGILARVAEQSGEALDRLEVVVRPPT